MGKKSIVSKSISFVAWLTGIIIALAIGFAMIGGTLTVPYIPAIIAVIAGWIVIISTVAGAILAIINRFQ